MPKHRRWLIAAIAAATTETLPPMPWHRRRAATAQPAAALRSTARTAPRAVLRVAAATASRAAR